ncbi:MAG: MarR family transcriptional regulator [Syntrophomonadaceae bacterium]|nr:MarR family transcriptional regulator [Syntrophomonadaceae bacterium]
MKDLISKEEIIAFHELYHSFVIQSTTSSLIVPKELEELSPIDISIVNIVSSNPGIKIGKIAEVLNAPNSTLTSALNRLVKKGILKRTTNPSDKRSYEIELTEIGTQVQQKHLEFEQAYFNFVLEKLDTHEERALLLDLLKKIARS